MQLPPGVPQLGLPDIKGCLPGGGGLGTYWVNGFLSSLFDGVAFVLSLIPCLAAWHASLKTGIGRILIRDGIVFFAVCFIASLANIVSVNCNTVIAYLFCLVPDTLSLPYSSTLSFLANMLTRHILVRWLARFKACALVEWSSIFEEPMLSRQIQVDCRVVQRVARVLQVVDLDFRIPSFTRYRDLASRSRISQPFLRVAPSIVHASLILAMDVRKATN